MACLRIMVVEDDDLIAVLLGEMLEGLGHEVCAIEATEALAVKSAARCHPDLMIVDVRLREGDGVSAVRRISRASRTPHLFVSGDLSRVRAEMPRAAMLQKPYNETELVSGIERAVAAGSA